jgi:hypothetical protein
VHCYLPLYCDSSIILVHDLFGIIWTSGVEIRVYSHIHLHQEATAEFVLLQIHKSNHREINQCGLCSASPLVCHFGPFNSWTIHDDVATVLLLLLLLLLLSVAPSTVRLRVPLLLIEVLRLENEAPPHPRLCVVSSAAVYRQY